MTAAPAIKTEARQAADAAQRRLLAEAVCGLIAEHGVEAATFRRVAAELGCTTGLVAHYFPTRDAFLAEALHTALAEVATVAFPAGSTTAPHDLDEWVECLVDTLRVEPTSQRFWRVIAAFQATAFTSESLAQVLRGYADGARGMLRELIAKELSDHDDAHINELTAALWAVSDGIGVSAALNPEQLPPDRVRDLLRGAWRGLLGVSA